MKKIGISTVFTGYNYGSSLQALATKNIIYDMGYEPIILSVKGSLIKGRDVRVKKIGSIMARFIFHPIKIKRGLINYKQSVSKKYSNDTICLFEKFVCEFIKPNYLSWSKLKKNSKKNDYLCFLCGSDQVWNGDALYVDPQYYLRYSPKNKRVAFAPSIGRDKINNLNIKKMRKFINEIPYLSIREEQGVDIIKKLCNRNALNILDPTLLISKEKWIDICKKNVTNIENIPSKFILAYFLSEQSEDAKKMLEYVSEKYNLTIINLPYETKNNGYLGVGPLEFLSLVEKANFIFTDSFHGTAFSLNFNKQFYVFKRLYNNAGNQSSRIISLLNKVDLIERLNLLEEKEITDEQFKKINKFLNSERNIAKDYLKNAITSINNEK